MSTAPNLERHDGESAASGSPAAGYSMAHRALHWLTAALVVSLVTIGLVMSDADPDGSTRVVLSRAHAVLGIATGLVLLTRLVLKLRTKVAPLPMSGARRALMRTVHAAIYVVLFAILASGAATSIKSDWPSYLRGITPSAPDLHALLPRAVHETLVFTLLGLVAVHVVGVVLFELQHRGALARMLPWRSRS